MGSRVVEIRIAYHGFRNQNSEQSSRGQNWEQRFQRSELGTKVLEDRIGNKGSRGQNWELEVGMGRDGLGTRVLEVRIGN